MSTLEAFHKLQASSVRRFAQDPLVSLMRPVFAFFVNKINTPSWFGVGPMQEPSDIVMFQEVLYSTRPQVLIETGTAGGGMTQIFAEFMRRIHGAGNFRVITIERILEHPNVEDLAKIPEISMIFGDSSDPEVVRQVQALIPEGWSVACTLDSDHSAYHVAKELDAYGPLVTPGQYLVVQDTYLGLYFPVGDYVGGPLGAVEAFLIEHPEFEIDMYPQRWLITQNPFGWLKRKT